MFIISYWIFAIFLLLDWISYSEGLLSILWDSTLLIFISGSRSLGFDP